MNVLTWILILITFSANHALAEIDAMGLRGQGDVRYMGFIKVYDAYLYTPQLEDTKDILSEDISKCLALDYAVSLSSKDFITGADAILKKQHQPERLRQVQAQIDVLNNAYQAVKQGDQYRLCYDASTATTTLFLNDKPLVAILSADFGKVYFGIWLGPLNPISKDLRDDLLNPGRW